VTCVLITGMSGTGKSTLLVELARRGHEVVDTDTDEWSHWITRADGSLDWIWRDAEMTTLLQAKRDDPLFVAGCKTNQGDFSSRFDEVVLLSAPTEVLLDRISRRSDNPYGKRDDERALIIEHIDTVEPLLRRTSSVELDATQSVDALATQLERIAQVR
jgi:dephospho-CoA kinase